MSNEPAEAVVEHEIKATVASMKTPHMRPNKLRKHVCKQIKETNWTQYQRVLDKLVQDGSLQTKEVDGEQVILSLGKATKASKDVSASPLQKQKVMTHEMEVPFDIILYLTRKGRRKQTNIETNTKTELSFDAETVKAMLSHVSSRDQNSTITITNMWSFDEGSDEKEAKKKAKKQVDAAIACISRMIISFQDNPDHFTRKKAGGTFAEQAETKQRKLEIAKKRRKKSSNDDKDEAAASEGDEASKKKKRQRKFY
mmetsp:Transcript_14100/g.21139  ORF Transcript_14100/g.21139 Transcript_14100/m.21139 type:complete len:255 (+) Transcript_14100:89-853(+)